MAPKNSGVGWRKKSTVIDNPKVLKSIPKDPRKEKLFFLMKNPDDTDVLMKIRELARNNIGVQEVVMVIKENGEKHALKMPFKVDICSDLLGGMKELIGEENIKVV